MAKQLPMAAPKQQPGPEADRLVIEGLDWEPAADKLLEKPRPAEGWPKHDEKPQAKKPPRD